MTLDESKRDTFEDDRREEKVAKMSPVNYWMKKYISKIAYFL